MSNPNIVSVWSPAGEGPFEMSRANARDLTSHAGWSYSPPEGVAPAPVAAPKVEDNGSTSTGESRTGAESADADEGTSENADEGTGEEAGEEEGEVDFTKPEHFEGMDREAVVAILGQKYPDFKPHHLSKVDTLIAKAVELANA